MRVISQNGMIDVPYEMTVFHVTGTFIRMNMVGDTGKGTVIAEYNTPAKAERAMEMLYEAYTGMIALKNIEILEEECEHLKEMLHRGFGTIAYCSNDNSAKIEPMNIVFRFPSEDEIE